MLSMEMEFESIPRCHTVHAWGYRTVSYEVTVTFVFYQTVANENPLVFCFVKAHATYQFPCHIPHNSNCLRGLIGKN